jgi:hypothetical protein
MNIFYKGAFSGLSHLSDHITSRQYGAKMDPTNSGCSLFPVFQKQNVPQNNVIKLKEYDRANEMI